MKKLCVIFIFFLCSCQKPNQEIDLTTKVRQFIKDSCPISSNIKTNRDVILAALVFFENDVHLNKTQVQLLNKVIKVYNDCHNKIMIIGNISSYEKQHNASFYNLAYFRAEQVYQYLIEYIDSHQISVVSCGDARNQYEENNNRATLGNQRVEIIMLNNSYYYNNKNNFICFNQQ